MIKHHFEEKKTWDEPPPELVWTDWQINKSVYHSIARSSTKYDELFFEII